jgi:hypothetical protein
MAKERRLNIFNSLIDDSDFLDVVFGSGVQPYQIDSTGDGTAGFIQTVPDHAVGSRGFGISGQGLHSLALEVVNRQVHGLSAVQAVTNCGAGVERIGIDGVDPGFKGRDHRVIGAHRSDVPPIHEVFHPLQPMGSAAKL